MVTKKNLLLFPLLLYSCGAFAEVDWVKAAKEIRYLKPSDFRNVPSQVLEKIVEHGCGIPQSWDRRDSNLIRGHFSDSNSLDWAVLCSKGGKSSILIIWEKSSQCPSSLSAGEDKDYLQAISDNKAGFSRSISVASGKSILAYQKAFGGALPKAFDHEGIDDVFVGKSSVVHYCQNGQWLKLQGAD